SRNFQLKLLEANLNRFVRNLRQRIVWRHLQEILFDLRPEFFRDPWPVRVNASLTKQFTFGRTAVVGSVNTEFDAHPRQDLVSPILFRNRDGSGNWWHIVQTRRAKASGASLANCACSSSSSTLAARRKITEQARNAPSKNHFEADGELGLAGYIVGK